MAKLVKKAASAAPAAVQPSDMEVLHPERIVPLGGETIIVREYGNVEWLRALPQAAPLVAAIAEMLTGPEEPTYELALDAIATHTDALLPLILQAADRDMAWFERLPPGDAELLIMTWWGVNGHFFVQRASNRVSVARAVAAQKPSAGAPSTQP